jgi:hypothetical protein
MIRIAAPWRDYRLTRRTRNRCLILLLVLLPALAAADKPTWARKATGFAGVCTSGNCRPLRIVAPDKKSAVEVLYQDGNAYLRITAPDQPVREVRDVSGSPSNDLLWAPDSKAFFVDGGEGMSSPGFVQVYLLDEAQVRALDVTQQAEQDMVKTYPPCKAVYLDLATCRKMERDPEYNLTAIDWVKDSSAMVMMAEVPCTSNFGGIMCQSMGYEVEVPSGKILKRMTPPELKTEWQKEMVQRFRIPEPPQYQN